MLRQGARSSAIWALSDTSTPRARRRRSPRHRRPHPRLGLLGAQGCWISAARRSRLRSTATAAKGARRSWRRERTSPGGRRGDGEDRQGVGGGQVGAECPSSAREAVPGRSAGRWPGWRIQDEALHGPARAPGLRCLIGAPARGRWLWASVRTRSASSLRLRHRTWRRGRVAIAVAVGRQRVDSIDPVAGAHQRDRTLQAAVDLDADDHLSRILGMIGGERMQLGEPAHGYENRTRSSPAALVHHQHVVMGLGPLS